MKLLQQRHALSLPRTAHPPQSQIAVVQTVGGALRTARVVIKERRGRLSCCANQRTVTRGEQHVKRGRRARLLRLSHNVGNGDEPELRGAAFRGSWRSERARHVRQGGSALFSASRAGGTFLGASERYYSASRAAWTRSSASMKESCGERRGEEAGGASGRKRRRATSRVIHEANGTHARMKRAIGKLLRANAKQVLKLLGTETTSALPPLAWTRGSQAGNSPANSMMILLLAPHGSPVRS